MTFAIAITPIQFRLVGNDADLVGITDALIADVALEVGGVTIDAKALSIPIFYSGLVRSITRAWINETGASILVDFEPAFWVERKSGSFLFKYVSGISGRTTVECDITSVLDQIARLGIELRKAVNEFDLTSIYRQLLGETRSFETDLLSDLF